jgi:adenylyltransferase/sulfurtransferase
MGSLQSIETIKLLTSIGEPLVGRMLFINLKSMEFETMKIRSRKDCNSCG